MLEKPMRRVLFIGAINENSLPGGGEEYKNQLIISKLKNEDVYLNYFDTINWKKSIVFLFRLLWNVLFVNYDNIIISASSVSTYRLLNVLYFVRRNKLKKVSYFVIGGYFPDAIISGRFKSSRYIGLNSIVVEGRYLKNKLMDHIPNVNIEVCPNFKEFSDFNFPEKAASPQFRFLFIGRISASKGILDIIKAANIIRNERPELDFVVDFYGPIEEEFEFDQICKYRGYLNFRESPNLVYQELNTYDCLLFPTKWQGEGFPGVIIDAYIAGLPVIASDWNMNTEIIREGENGFIIPPNDIGSLSAKMIWLMGNRNQCLEIGLKNREVAKMYNINSIWPELFSCVK